MNEGKINRALCGLFCLVILAGVSDDDARYSNVDNTVHELSLL